VTTWAGQAGEADSTDGRGAAARFWQPLGLAVDDADNVYVADSGNSLIRRIDPAGSVTTLAGKEMEVGSVDGVGAEARFHYPTGLAVD